MKRALALAVMLTGCASGVAPNATSDGPPGTVDAARDAAMSRDSLVVLPDAPHITPIDAPHLDAFVQLDAPHPDAFVPPIDAPHPDAFVPPIDAPHPDAFVPPIDAPHPDAFVPPPPDACVPQVTQLLVNPAFDLSPAGTGWSEDEPEGFELIGAYVNPEQSAPFNAFLGGETGDGDVTDFLTQNVAIPPLTTKLELTGFYAVITDESGTHVYDSSDVAIVQTNGTPIEDVLRTTNATPVGSWTQFDHTFTSLSSLSGKTVQVRLTSTNDDTNETDFLFDTFSLTATHGCP
jgi:hypothetical protein